MTGPDGVGPAGSPDKTGGEDAAADGPAGPGDSAEQTPTGRLVPIIANPFSGRGANRRRVDALAEALRGLGLSPRLIWTPAERRAALADADTRRDCRCVVSAGGDGSLADVINDLAAEARPDAVPLATWPMGNENLFAREFGFSRRATRLAETIARGRIRRIDAATLGERWFTLMAGSGFDADVVHRMARWRGRDGALRRVSRLSYVGRVLSSLRRYRYPPITLETEAQSVTGAHAFVFNIGQYGMNLGLAPDASADDGLLDWIVFKRPGRLQLIRYGLAVYLGRHRGLADVDYGRASRVRLAGEAAAQADGDPGPPLPSEVIVHPGALRVLTPPAWEPRDRAIVDRGLRSRETGRS